MKKMVMNGNKQIALIKSMKIQDQKKLQVTSLAKIKMKKHLSEEMVDLIQMPSQTLIPNSKLTQMVKKNMKQENKIEKVALIEEEAEVEEGDLMIEVDMGIEEDLEIEEEEVAEEEIEADLVIEVEEEAEVDVLVEGEETEVSTIETKALFITKMTLVIANNLITLAISVINKLTNLKVEIKV